MIDKQLLFSCADAVEVAEAIGMEIKRKGKKIYCTCPSHKKVLGREDNNIGNCVIDSRGYYCFACNSKGNVFDMVMDFCECSFGEAVKKVAKLTGGNFFINEARQKTKTQPFTSKDLELIGLSSIASPKGDAGRETLGASNSRPTTGSYFRKGDEYIVYASVPRITLNQLFAEDEDIYYQLIIDNARISLDKCTKIYESFSNRGSAEFALIFDLLSHDGELDSARVVEIKNILALSIKRINAILKEAQAHLSEKGCTE